MKLENTLLNKIVIFLICLLCLTGCWNYSFTNPTPDIIHSDQISYDEYGNKTSGIISVSDDKTGFIVTENFINRFNSMIEKYGKKFQPELKKNQGTYKIDKTNYYFMSNQSMGTFLTLNDLRRMDANAAKKK